ncbi:hypothetical protein HDE76_003783 [Rhodanobacter sp. ANJX3]|nr:hypothetical protein [Rhodanobacter sp. ANJX3]
MLLRRTLYPFPIHSYSVWRARVQRHGPLRKRKGSIRSERRPRHGSSTTTVCRALSRLRRTAGLLNDGLATLYLSSCAAASCRIWPEMVSAYLEPSLSYGARMAPLRLFFAVRTWHTVCFRTVGREETWDGSNEADTHPMKGTACLGRTSPLGIGDCT